MKPRAKAIDASMLRPGYRLPLNLFTSQGVKLLAGGVVLSESMCRAIRLSRWGELYLASTARDLVASGSLTRIERADPGELAPSDLLTEGGVIAVQAGETIEPHHASALSLGAFATSLSREDRRQRAVRLKIADQRVAELLDSWRHVPLRIARDPLAHAERGRTSQGPEPAQVLAMRAGWVERHRGIFSRLLAGLPVALDEINPLVRELIDQRRTHPARFAQFALLPGRRDDDLCEHGVAVAVLSISIAARLGWNTESQHLAGLAGLLADLGMGLVPEELRIAARALDESEINRVRRHPAHAVVLLDSLDRIPDQARRAVYQHHERDNGSGYPSGLRGKAIADLSKVVAVADTFAAATARRRYRANKRPYEAIEELVMIAASGKFDRRIVRALIEAVGLFPVGSWVLLSTNEPAMVVGADAANIDRPIVRVERRDQRTAPAAGTSPRGAGLTIHLADFSRGEIWVKQTLDTPVGALMAA